MAYERDNRGRVFTHSRDEFGDFGAFGEVPVDQPYQHILVPKAILPSSRYSYNGNQRVNPDDYFPRPFFTVPVIRGPYKIAVVEAWLKSIGADLASVRITDENGTPGIDGTKVGLCFWPPVEFNSQLHLDAWLAYWKTWRRELNHVDWQGNPATASSCMQMFETADMPGGARPELLSNNAIATLRRQTLDRWGAITDDEDVPHWPLPMTSGYDPTLPALQYEFEIPKLELRDPERHAKIMILYLFGCMHMAYWTSLRYRQSSTLVLQVPGLNTCPGLPDHPAFPGVQQLPYLNEYAPNVADIFTSMFTGAILSTVTSLATGGVAKISSGISNAVTGMAANFAKLANAESKSASFAGLSAPSEPMWTSFVVPITEFANWPSSSISTTPIIAPTIPVPLTEGVRALSSVQQGLRSGTILFSPQFYAERGIPMPKLPGSITEEESSLPLLAALGLGGYLLWKYLRK